MEHDDELEEELGPAVPQTINLAKGHELRIESSGTRGDVKVVLDDGAAEVFGAELQKGKEVKVTGQKLAVYTWSGCKLTVQGRPEVIYEADETPMVSYLNLHTSLNNRREAAKQHAASSSAAAAAAGGAAPQQQRPGPGLPGLQQQATPSGPRVVVLGPTDSGKSTLCRMLANWAVRSGWAPTLVDLDVGQGTITVPGCVAATALTSPIDVEEGLGQEMPLVYFYGHASPADNPELYKFLVDRLARILERRAAADPQHAGASGLIINTLGWVDGLGYELQVDAIEALKADMVVVIEQDRLYSQLSSELRSRPGVTVRKVAKSGGVVVRQRDERRCARDQRIREYFYGGATTLSPVLVPLELGKHKVFRVGGGPKASSSILPIDGVSANDPLKPTYVSPGSELVQSLLAVSHAGKPEELLTTNVAGFVLVQRVDTAQGVVSLLSPSPGPLPGPYLLLGSLRSNIQ